MQKKDGHGQVHKKETTTTTTAALPDLEALAAALRSDPENVHRYTTSQEAKSVQQHSRAIRERSLAIFPRAKQWDARLPRTQLSTAVHATNCGSSGPAVKCALLPLHLRMSAATARGTLTPPLWLRAGLLLVLSCSACGTHRPGRVSAEGCHEVWQLSSEGRARFHSRCQKFLGAGQRKRYTRSMAGSRSVDRNQALLQWLRTFLSFPSVQTFPTLSSTPEAILKTQLLVKTNRRFP